MYPPNSNHVLITGDAGFVGRHALQQWPHAIGLAAVSGGLDIRNKAALIDFLSLYPVQSVLHLAAQSFVPASFESPQTTFEINFLGTLRLLEALSETGFKGSFLFVGSADTYGRVDVDQLPVGEECALRPRNPYAVSKVAAEALCYQWSQTGPFRVMMARPFNHIGAGQTSRFVISDFARQIAEIGAGKRPPLIAVGDIEVTRDFTDVYDVIAAYELIINHGKNGEVYNICSGVERSIRSVIERLLSLSGVKADILVDPSRFRAQEQRRMWGSHVKLSQQTGWYPAAHFDETLLNLYRYWELNVDK